MTTSRQTPRMISVDLLHDNDDNVRAQIGDTTELVASIRQHGLVQPIVVTEHPHRADEYLVLAGHRRLAAAREIGLERVPAIVRHEAGGAEDHIALMLVENMQRSNLSAVEKAKAMQRLIDHGMTQTDVARRLGVTPATVNVYIMLLDLPEEDLAQIEAGEVKVGDAREAVRQARAAQRRRAGSPDRGRPPTRSNYFGRNHPLADTVKAACDHTTRPSIGHTGCGQCWEAAIRDDALATAQVAS